MICSIRLEFNAGIPFPLYVKNISLAASDRSSRFSTSSIKMLLISTLESAWLEFPKRPSHCAAAAEGVENEGALDCLMGLGFSPHPEKSKQHRSKEKEQTNLFMVRHRVLERNRKGAAVYSYKSSLDHNQKRVAKGS